MRKKGFTLAEALIALGIVGIVAALALPMFNKTKPDPIKMSYLKTYDSIVTAVGTLAKNRKLYPMEYKYNNDTTYDNFNTDGTYYDFPLFNTMPATDVTTGVKLNAGNKKLCEALSFAFGATSNTCSESITEYKDDTFKANFTAQNGTEFMVSTNIPLVGPDNFIYETSVYFDVDGAKGNNCLYKKESCTAPDRFKVFVLADGSVKPADPAGKGYLKTRNLINKMTLKPIGEDVDEDAGPDAIKDPDKWCDGTGGILNGQECKPCDGNTYAEDGVCKVCEGGEVVDGGCKPCSDLGKVWNGSACEICQGKIQNGECKSCSDFNQLWNGTSCESCKSPLIFNSISGKCGCPSSTPYLSNGTCYACNPATKPTLTFSQLQANFAQPTCINGEWRINCKDGYLYNINTKTCVKIDACGPKPAYTPPNGTLVCKDGAWVVQCNTGYSYVGGVCQKISVQPPSSNDDNCVDKPALGIYCKKDAMDSLQTNLYQPF